MIRAAMEHDTSAMGDDVRFQTTSWNLVRSSKSLKALDALISIYWKPLYFFVRRRGFDNETAKDLVQDFLSVLLERHSFSKADPARGRFRTFLLASMSNFLKDHAKAASRVKRGGGMTFLSLDFERGESEYKLVVSVNETPETALNRGWARSLWDRAISELVADADHLMAFQLYLENIDTRTIAARTGLTEAAVNSCVHRLKHQLREIILGHIRETVSNEEELQAELAEFKSLLS
ncbi:MAG TPA: sigma-70 family RNA polymerase sigma factor [Planctomycetota bacterium]|nr:sigma-70 family RNA polymerase sigma factor [Planctomycetota bacterium]